MSKEEAQEITDMIQDCINRESKLNNWEKHFIIGLDDINPENLTARQRERLDHIWERVTS